MRLELQLSLKALPTICTEKNKSLIENANALVKYMFTFAFSYHFK